MRNWVSGRSSAECLYDYACRSLVGRRRGDFHSFVADAVMIAEDLKQAGYDDLSEDLRARVEMLKPRGGGKSA